MASTRTKARKAADTKTPKSFRLSSAKIAAAQRALGAATATEAIETALDLVVFRQGLVDGTRAMFGVEIRSPDPVR
jgi:DNA-binding helix-hairpin-helix protein with protein kinase domain